MVDQLLLLHGINTPDGFISQCSNYSTELNINRQSRYAAGHEHPLSIFTISQSPTGSFSSTQLKTILDLTDIGMKAFSGNTDLYFKKAEDGGSRIANTELEHFRYRCAKANLIPQSISVSQADDLASIQCGLQYLFDGTNEPIVPAGSQAVSGTSAFAEGYGMGPIYLNGSLVNGVSSMSIDFGITLKIRGSDGDHWPSWCSIESINPMIRFSCYRESLLAYGVKGTSLTSVSAYLRQKTKIGYVANGTATHMKFSGTSGAIFVESHAGGNNDDAMADVVIQLTAPSAAGVPLSLNTAIAITS